MSMMLLDSECAADCLGELAGLFGAPLEEADVAVLMESGQFGRLQALARDPAHARDLATAIAAVRSAGSVEAATTRLNVDYCRLFLGLTGSAATQPIESAHRGDGRLFQDPVDSMTTLLVERGLRPADGFVEPPDHLTIELSLLEQLLRLDLGLLDVDESAAIETLRRRLAEWTPRFAEACRAADQTGFYAALARLLVRLLVEAEPTSVAA